MSPAGVPVARKGLHATEVKSSPIAVTGTTTMAPFDGKSISTISPPAYS